MCARVDAQGIEQADRLVREVDHAIARRGHGRATVAARVVGERPAPEATTVDPAGGATSGCRGPCPARTAPGPPAPSSVTARGSPSTVDDALPSGPADRPAGLQDDCCRTRPIASDCRRDRPDPLRGMTVACPSWRACSGGPVVRRTATRGLDGPLQRRPVPGPQPWMAAASLVPPGTGRVPPTSTVRRRTGGEVPGTDPDHRPAYEEDHVTRSSRSRLAPRSARRARRGASPSAPLPPRTPAACRCRRSRRRRSPWSSCTRRSRTTHRSSSPKDKGYFDDHRPGRHARQQVGHRRDDPAAGGRPVAGGRFHVGLARSSTPSTRAPPSRSSRSWPRSPTDPPRPSRRCRSSCPRPASTRAS